MLSRLRQCKLYRRIALLALLAMFVPSLVMLAQSAMAMPMNGPMDGMHHCGMAAAKHAPADNKAPAKHSSCPICQTMHMLGGGFPVPKPVAFGPVVRTAVVIRQAGLGQPLLRHWLTPRSQPRAPPVLA